MHGRNRMTIDPRIPTMPVRRTSGFHQPGRPCLHQARSAVRCSASRMKGDNILPRTALNTDFDTLCLLSCLWMTAPTSYFVFWCGHPRDSHGYYYVTELLCFLVWPLQRQQWVSLCNCLVLRSYSHYVVRSFPSCGVRVLHPTHYDI